MIDRPGCGFRRRGDQVAAQDQRHVDLARTNRLRHGGNVGGGQARHAQRGIGREGVGEALGGGGVGQIGQSEMNADPVADRPGEDGREDREDHRRQHEGHHQRGPVAQEGQEHHAEGGGDHPAAPTRSGVAAGSVSSRGRRASR